MPSDVKIGERNVPTRGEMGFLQSPVVAWDGREKLSDKSYGSPFTIIISPLDHAVTSRFGLRYDVAGCKDEAITVRSKGIGFTALFHGLLLSQ
jgi:hypothetical protein